jgi:NAD(P)-dependent dehydrogenase (short-subunit alcohol dehydrogenase family)
VCDVAQEADCVSVVEQTVATYGRLDGAFNNAGVSGGDWESTSGAAFSRLAQPHSHAAAGHVA